MITKTQDTGWNLDEAAGSKSLRVYRRTVEFDMRPTFMDVERLLEGKPGQSGYCSGIDGKTVKLVCEMDSSD